MQQIYPALYARTFSDGTNYNIIRNNLSLSMKIFSKNVPIMCYYLI